MIFNTFDEFQTNHMDPINEKTNFKNKTLKFRDEIKYLVQNCTDYSPIT